MLEFANSGPTKNSTLVEPVCFGERQMSSSLS
jgi:hypothetical protein